MELPVNLGDHSYNLIIQSGALDRLASWVSNLWKKRKIVIITDTNVQKFYLDQVLEQLKADDFSVSYFVIPAGEASKSLKVAEEIYAFLTVENLTRSDGIIALGGGVVGDLAGFVASTFLRGIHFLQIPTTLLAQVDSSIGGKTAVNTSFGKNLVGTFAQPDGVLIDPETLKTLEIRRIREGIGEIVKYAATFDFLLWEKLLTFNNEDDLVNDATEIIYDCCDLKRRVVEEDEFDNGKRLLLNFGHTIGHAVEKVAGFSVITHGEGVAIGMVKITTYAEKLGLSPAGTAMQLIAMLKKFHLPVDYTPWNVDRLYDALRHDKKTRGAMIKTIILERIGHGVINEIPLVEMKNYLKQ